MANLKLNLSEFVKQVCTPWLRKRIAASLRVKFASPCPAECAPAAAALRVTAPKPAAAVATHAGRWPGALPRPYVAGMNGAKKDIDPSTDLAEPEEEQNLPDLEPAAEIDLAAGAGPLAAGRAVIARYAKLAPESARRLPHDRRPRRGALCRQGQEHQQAHPRLYPADRLRHPHRAHDRRHRGARVRVDRDRDRGAAARGQPDQAAAAALQRAAARRQVVSLYPDHRRSLGAADLQAPRRAQPSRAVLRSVRLGRRGQPHHHGAAARLPAALLLGRLLREPHPAVPAVPDQALLGPLHRRDRLRRICRAGARGQRVPVGAQPHREGGAGGRDGEGVRRARFRARRDLSRPAGRALGGAGASGHQSAQRRGGGRVRGAPGGRLQLRRGVLLPHRPELGQPGLFPPRRPLGRRRARCWARSWASSTTTSRRRG